MMVEIAWPPKKINIERQRLINQIMWLDRIGLKETWQIIVKQADPDGVYSKID